MFSIVDLANVVINVENVSDLQWFPSNLHIHLLQNVDAPHPLETSCHVPSLLPSSILLVVPLMAMSPMVSLASTPSTISLVEMSFLVLLQSV